MYYLKKFDNKDDLITFIYNGGWADTNLPGVEYVKNIDKVYYSGMDEANLLIPPGYRQLQYIENTGTAYIDLEESVSLLNTLSITFSETTNQESVIVCNIDSGGTKMLYFMYHNWTNFYSIVRDNNGQNVTWENNAQNIMMFDEDGNIPNIKLNVVVYPKVSYNIVNHQLIQNNSLHVSAYNIEANDGAGEELHNADHSLASGSLSDINFTDGHLRLFASPTGGVNFKGRLYHMSLGKNTYAAMYAIDYTTYEYIPAQEISTNKIGLIKIARTYTKLQPALMGTGGNVNNVIVEKSFVEATGTFIAGPIIDPNIDEHL